MRFKKFIATALAAAMVAGSFAATAFAESEWNPEMKTGDLFVLDNVKTATVNWYINEKDDDHMIRSGDMYKFIKEDDQYLLISRREDDTDRHEWPVSIADYRISRDQDTGGKYIELPNFVIGDVDRFNSSDSFTLKNIVKSRAYNGNVPAITANEVTGQRGYGFYKGLLMGDMLLKEAHGNYYSEINSSAAPCNISFLYKGDEYRFTSFEVGRNGSIYLDGDPEDEPSISIPAGYNAWLIEERTCYHDDNYSKTVLEIAPIKYDHYDTYSVNCSGNAQLSTQSGPFNFTLTRSSCTPDAANKVYEYDPVKITTSSDIPYPFVINYGDDTYTSDELPKENGKIVFEVDEVEHDIEITGKNVSYSNRKYIAVSEYVPEKFLYETGFGDLFIPRNDFVKTFDTLMLANYKGATGSSAKTFEDATVYFHTDGSMTVETATTVADYELADGFCSWLVLKNKNGELSLRGTDIDVSMYCQSSANTTKYVSSGADFSDISSGNPYLTYKLSQDVESSGFGLFYDLVLDLNGHQLILDGGSINLHYGCTLIVKNGTIMTDDDNPIFVCEDEDGGYLRLDGVILKNTNEDSLSPLFDVEDGNVDIFLTGTFSYNFANFNNKLVAVKDKSNVRFISTAARTNITDSVVDGCLKPQESKGVFSYIYPISQHDFDEAVYSWTPTANGYTCTATVTCKDKAAHQVTETVNATLFADTKPTCENIGHKTWEAEFTKEPFERQYKTDEVPATGHVWGEPDYVWDKEANTCTATRACTNDPSHVQTETVAGIEAGPGYDIWTAKFENEAFEEQSYRPDSWKLINKSDFTEHFADMGDGINRYYLSTDGWVTSSKVDCGYFTKDCIIDLNGFTFSLIGAYIAKDVTVTFIDSSSDKSGVLQTYAGTGYTANYGISSYAGIGEDDTAYLVLDGVSVLNKSGYPAVFVNADTPGKGNLELSIGEGTTFASDRPTNVKMFGVSDYSDQKLTINSNVAFVDPSDYVNSPFSGRVVSKTNDSGDYKYTYIVTKASYAPSVAGHALTLEDNIGVSFYLDLPDGYFNSNTEITFEWGPKSMTITGDQLVRESITSTSQTYNCIVKCGVAARYMTEKISMTVTRNGISVLEDEYRIVDYASQAAARYANEPKLMNLLCNMLAYGGEAQKYFKYKTDDLASDYISKVDKSWTRTDAPASLTDDTSIPAEDLAALGIKFEGASLVCTEKTALRLYFTGVNGWPDGLTFTSGGKTLTPGEAGSMYFVEISGINPQDIYGSFTVSISGAGGSAALVYDTAKYYNTIEASDKEEHLAFRPVVEAMHGYWKSSNNFEG